MATREENLKKINAELEAMSDEELEQVAGGVYINYDGLESDKNFLNGLLGTNLTSNSDSFDFKNAWKECGVMMRIAEIREYHMGYGHKNGYWKDKYVPRYFNDTRELTQAEAYDYAKKFLGK